MPTRGQSLATDAKALAEIQRLARLGWILITQHANQRMRERGVTEMDVHLALLTAQAAVRQPDRETWRVTGGVTTDDDQLTLICDIESDIIVVTVF